MAMCDIIDHYTATNPMRKPLFIADRGFVSFNVFAHAIENNAYFLVRARETSSKDHWQCHLVNCSLFVLFNKRNLFEKNF